MSFETHFLHFSASIFFVCLSGKTLDRFFILLHHCFYSCKPQIYTNQTGLTIRFVIPRKILCSCVQKIKNKHDGGADVAFFVSACITHSLVERLLCLLRYLVIKTKALGTKKRNSEDLLTLSSTTSFPKKHIFKNERRNYQQKKTIQSQKKKKMWQRRTKPLLLLCFTDFEQVFVAWVASFIFSFLD